MKILFLVVSMLFCSVSFGQENLAAKVVHLDFGDEVVSTGAWSNVIPLLQKSSQGVLISNNSSVAVYIGVAQSGAAYGAEAANLVIPASSGAVYSPLYIPQGKKISVKAIGDGLGPDGIGAGSLDINLINYFQ